MLNDAAQLSSSTTGSRPFAILYARTHCAYLGCLEVRQIATNGIVSPFYHLQSYEKVRYPYSTDGRHQLAELAAIKERREELPSTPSPWVEGSDPCPVIFRAREKERDPPRALGQRWDRRSDSAANLGHSTTNGGDLCPCSPEMRVSQPEGVQSDLPNLSIPVGRGRETNEDYLSNGE